MGKSVRREVQRQEKVHQAWSESVLSDEDIEDSRSPIGRLRRELMKVESRINADNRDWGEGELSITYEMY